MAFDKEAEQRLALAQKQGFEVRDCGSGAVKVTNPKTGESRVVSRRDHGRNRQNSLADLRNLGVDLAPRTKAKRRKNRRLKPPEETAMPAPVNNISLEDREFGRVVDAIIDDKDSAALLLEAVREAAVGQPYTYRGQVGLRWTGDLYNAIARRLWEGLPPNIGHPQALRIHEEIIARLRDEKALLPVSNPQGSPMVTWWVAPDEAPAHAEAATGGTLAIAVKDEKSGGLDLQVYECAECSFADNSRNALIMHRNQANELGRHPAEEGGPYKCPDPQCASVRTTIKSYKQHLKSAHGYQGFMCVEDLSWWPDRTAFAAHRKTHAEPTAGSVETLVPHAIISPAPADEPSDDLAASAQAFAKILADYERIKREDDAKDEEIARLKAENKEISATLKRIQRAIGK